MQEGAGRASDGGQVGWGIYGRVVVCVESVGGVVALEGGCGEVVCQDISWCPLYFGIVGVSSVGFMDIENVGGDVLVIIKDLSQVGVLRGVRVSGIGLEMLPCGG